MARDEFTEYARGFNIPKEMLPEGMTVQETAEIAYYTTSYVRPLVDIDAEEGDDENK